MRTSQPQRSFVSARVMHPRALAALILVVVLLSGCGLVANQSPAAPPAATTAEGTDCSRIVGACETENLLTTLVSYLTFLAELCGAFVIAVGVVRAMGRYVRHLFRPESPDMHATEDIRLRLGKSLALALEFEVGADILKTAVVPSLQIIAQLSAIIVLRTLLNYFLEREIRQAEQRRAGADAKLSTASATQS